MTRFIRFSEPRSKLSVSCQLLDDEAPRSSEFLWQLASRALSFEAMHAVWTGPELSCPLPSSVLPNELATSSVPQENATSYPKAGEIALAYLPSGSVYGLPPGPFFDIGLFYAEGARMLMPFGWIKANICARMVDSEIAQAREAIRTIQRGGACQLHIESV